jgi:hypothetical protein
MGMQAPRGRAVLVATFAPSAEWAGKAISYEDGRFTLEGFGPITPRAILEYDRLEQLLWATEDGRAWVEGLAVTVPVVAPFATTAVAPKKGLSRGVRTALIVGVVLVVAVLVAATVLRGLGGSTEPSISAAEMHQRLAQATAATVVDCRVSHGHADVAFNDSYTSQRGDYLAGAQRDCFDAFRVLFAPGTGVTRARVEVRVEAMDSFGLPIWERVYAASLTDRDAAKVDWESATAQQVSGLWTVDFVKATIQ